MIRGVVRGNEAQVEVIFRLPNRRDFSVQCVVDTGFAGALTLSSGAIAALDLPFFQEIDANLANDTDVKTAVHVATIIWNEREIEVAVLAMGRRPLLGTSLLEGSRLCIDFTEIGDVSIEAVE